MACLPAGQLGTSSAAAVAVQMQNAFPSLQYGLMVGIAGGVPSNSADVRLGDVVVSQPQGLHGGVVQYDFVKTGLGGQQFPNGSLNSPNPVLLQAVANMRSSTAAGRDNLPLHLSTINASGQFPRPASATDRLFKAACIHAGGDTCGGCQEGKMVLRLIRPSQDIVVHYETISSGNQVVKDGVTRYLISAKYGGVLCFEMEAAGLMNVLPCLVVRGICDYADSHKTKNWQPFAAAVAAACAKEVLSFVPIASRSLGTERFSEFQMSRSNTSTISTDGFGTYTTSKTRVSQDGVSSSSFYADSKPTPEELQLLHKSLRFGEMDARYATIQDAHSKTCLWLLDRIEYLDWCTPNKMNDHHGFFWIRGNPGTGKSTLMKFAFAAAGCTTTDRIIVKFFFNARGAALEKTVVGMWRPLLHQVFGDLPDLLHVFTLCPPPQNTRGPTQPEWDVGTLQTLLKHAVQRLGSRSLICFIDALDEGDEDRIREMVSLFEGLGDLANTLGLSFRTCFFEQALPAYYHRPWNYPCFGRSAGP